MRYSLLSQFRGTLLGALLAEALFAQAYPQSKTHIPSVDWGKITVMGAESLIALGKLDVEDWQERCLPVFPHLDTIEGISPRAILTVLPIALFFHENEVKLRHNLLIAVNLWQDDPLIRDCGLAIGYAIARSLVKTLNRATLIPQTISFLGNTETPIPQYLLKINKFLEQGAGLERVVTELNREQKPPGAIALAFYCFLSTLEDFRLSVERAKNQDEQSQIFGMHGLVSVITAALSGAYNSITGIPLTWRLSGAVKNSQALTKWGISNEAQMLKLADCLFAAWAGMYQPTQNSQGLNGKAAIASPRIIKLRSR
jgi:ADP-ribosylglycohydrolase